MNRDEVDSKSKEKCNLADNNLANKNTIQTSVESTL